METPIRDIVRGDGTPVSKPFVSVIVPLFNAANYVETSLKSICDQSFCDFELIVIDDGSTDNSRNLVQQFNDDRIRLFTNEVNLGPAASRNRAIDMARGNYIAFFDADDLASSNRLSQQIEFLSRNPSIGIVGSHVEVIQSDGTKSGEVWGYDGRSDHIGPTMLFRNCLATSTLLIRAEVIGQKRFRTDIPVASDYEFWTRLLRDHSAHVLPENLVQYRVHPANLSHSKQSLTENCLRQIADLQLRHMGLNPSNDELTLHRQVSCGLERSRAFVDAAESWLIQLRNANGTSKRFDQRPLDQVLAQCWRDLCWNTSSLGVWTWNRYRKSPLRLMASSSARHEFRFCCRIVRGALKKSIPRVSSSLRRGGV
jgi:hypothetical protein